MSSQVNIQRKYSRFGSEGALGALDIMQSGQKKRIDPRKQVQWRLEVQLKDKSRFKSTTVNVSRSGVMIKSPQPMDIGERVYLKIYAKHGLKSKIIDAVVEVKHVILSKGSYLAGALFIKVPDGTRDFIDAFVGNPSDNCLFRNEHEEQEYDDTSEFVSTARRAVK